MSRTRPVSKYTHFLAEEERYGLGTSSAHTVRVAVTTLGSHREPRHTRAPPSSRIARSWPHAAFKYLGPAVISLLATLLWSGIRGRQATPRHWIAEFPQGSRRSQRCALLIISARICKGERVVTSRLTGEIRAALPLGDARHHPRSAQSGAADVGKKPKLQWRRRRLRRRLTWPLEAAGELSATS
ncbi:hypothetical protein HPB48_003772 [Haemaphysalis longicornis]|uniref:Uncharacterized protein n=1 Tax=Haemaphysalis longicornis TaxID=44386 RepID=A0A9J6FFQ1_HAELO|nr:hypothetical protein HPB48_003772 [Haemaphysalis longicornis]